MRIVGLFFTMLVVFWITNMYVMDGFTTSAQGGFEFVLALTLFFGTMVAVPVIGYLLCADRLARLFRFPWSTFAYILLVALGCVLYAAILRYWKGNSLPTTSEGWYYYLYGYIPLLTTASVPLVWRFFGTTMDMADMSQKLKGDEVYVDAEKVKESNRAL